MIQRLGIACAVVVAVGCSAPAVEPVSEALTATPYLSDELELEAPEYRPDPGIRRTLGAVSLGDGWVVLRQPGRLHRLDRDGRLLDRVGVAIPTEVPIWMGLASDGRQLAVAYQRSFEDVHIYLQRYDADLRPVGAPVVIDPGSATYEIRVAIAGDTTLVAWTGNGIRGVRVRDGAVVDAAPIVIASEGGDPSIATDGRDFAVVSTESWEPPGTGTVEYEVWVARVTAAGDVHRTYVGDTAFLARPGICFGGGAYAVTLRLAGPGVSPQIGTALFSPTFEGRGGSQAYTGRDTLHSACAWAGDRFVVAWDDAGAAAQTVTLAGAGPVVRLPGTAAESLVAAGGGDRALIVGDRGAVRVSATEGVLDREAIAIAWQTMNRTWPLVVAGAGSYLVAWNEFWGHEDGRSVYRLYDGNGAPLGAAPTPFRGDRTLSPHVAFDGACFLAVWTEYDGVAVGLRAARIGADGELLDATPLEVAPPVEVRMELGGIAASRDGFLIAWADASGGPHVKARRVRCDGSMPPSFRVGDTADLFGVRAVSFDGETFRVFWHVAGASDTLRSSRVTEAGAVLDPGGVPGPGPTVEAAAGDGAAIQLAWTDERGVHTARVDRGGRGSAPAHVFDAIWWIGALAFDGAGFVVTGVGEDGLWVTRLGAGGRVLGGAHRLAGHQHNPPTAAALEPTRALVAYSVIDEGDPDEVIRAKLRVVTPLPAGAACERAVECLAGVCAEGVCIEVPDAGMPDAGIPDAGVPDAGAPDAAPAMPDAGGAPADPTPGGDDGCGCRTGGDASGALLFALTALSLAGRRRRARTA
jgi:MYXO-CTERM domain-containing protein